MSMDIIARGLAVKNKNDIQTNSADIAAMANKRNALKYIETKYPGFYKSKGLLIDDFSTGWTTSSSGTATLEADKTIYGNSTPKVVGNEADINVELNKNINMDFSEVKACLGFWFYLYDTTSMNSFTIYLTSTENTYSKYFSVNVSCNTMKIGWNFVKVFEADWSNTGGEDWSNTMQYMRILGIKNSGQTVTFNAGAILGNVISEPVLLIEFDDCLKSVYNEGFKYMSSKGLRGTVNLIGSTFTHESYMNLPEFRSIKENGWTVGNHTWSHVDLLTLTKAEQETELNNTRDLIVANGLGDGLHATYPYGNYNSDTLDVLDENGYKTGRQVLGEANNVAYGNPEFPYSLTCLAFDNSITLSDAITVFADIKAKQNIGIFLFHELTEVAGSDSWAISDFRSLIDTIVADGIKVITRDELYYYL